MSPATGRSAATTTTATHGRKSGMANRRPARFAWRPLLRGLHRDAGYLVVGFTLVYAVSGLAVNHIADWDPNFRSYRSVRQVPAPLPADDAAAAGQVLRRLGLEAKGRSVYRA